MIEICSAFDKNYCRMFINTASSILKDVGVDSVSFKLLVDCIETKIYLESLWREFLGLNIKLQTKVFQSETMSLFELQEGRNAEQRQDIKQIHYAQLFVSQYFPELEKFLWIEPDMIVLRDLQKLWEIGTGSHIIAACKVPSQFADPLALQQGPFSYFNAGLVLVNARKWNDHGLTELAINYIQENKKHTIYQFYTQGALNLSLRGDYLHIPQRYNYSAWPNYKYLIDPSFKDGEHSYSDRFLIEEVAILHYNGRALFSDSPMIDFYRDYDVTSVLR